MAEKTEKTEKAAKIKSLATKILNCKNTENLSMTQLDRVIDELNWAMEDIATVE